MGGIGLEHALTKPHVSIRITLRVRDSHDPTLQVRKLTHEEWQSRVLGPGRWALPVIFTACL